MVGLKTGSSRRDSGTRIQDPEGTQQNIIEVATAEFAEHGLAGARIDEIAAKTKSSKRMIYYYFGDKEGLYLRVLEAAYSKVRAFEATLHLDDFEPVEALRKLVEFTFDHHHSNQRFIRLVMIENIHHGAHLAASDAIRALNRGAISHLEVILARGREAGVFRADADPLAVHWQISAFSFFNVSNEATFSLIFGNALSEPKGQEILRRQVVETILNIVLTPARAPEG